MKDSERDGLLLVLAAASGSADGWSYFGLAHSFVANMTGNTVLLGISIFHAHGDIAHPLLAIAGYVAGVALGEPRKPATSSQPAVSALCNSFPSFSHPMHPSL